MKKIQTLLNFFLSEKFKDKSENVIIYISIFAFIIHLLFIFLNKFNFFDLALVSSLFSNPIAGKTIVVVSAMSGITNLLIEAN